MDIEKLSLLANGVASVSDATDSLFTDVLQALEEGGVITEEDYQAVIEYTGG